MVIIKSIINISYYCGHLTTKLISILAMLLLLQVQQVSAAQHHGTQQKNTNNKVENCKEAKVICAKTITLATAPNGDLWRVWVHQQSMYLQTSSDNGATFSSQKRVAIANEKISARKENRPKIAFDKFNGVYLSWAMPREKKYTADVRFSYSNDYGETFSQPVTINDDNLLAGHSFNEMLVSDNGDVSIVWLDSRIAYQLRKHGKESIGSALFMATANPRLSPDKHKVRFTNRQLANNTCVCCRIAMDFTQQGQLAILWRHIYPDNIREFALLTLTEDAQPPVPIQISYDHWQINGCPHQGGGISIDKNNRYHMVWFNLGDKGKGIYYVSSNDQGKTLTTPLSLGDVTAQAAYPHVMQNNQVIDIVWTQFNGVEHQLWHQKSIDNGRSFGSAKQIAQAYAGSDRPFIIKKGGVNIVSWQRPQQGHWVQVL